MKSFNKQISIFLSPYLLVSVTCNCKNFFADIPDFEEHAKKSKGNYLNEKVFPIDIIY